MVANGSKRVNSVGTEKKELGREEGLGVAK